mgnify:CR=1 FL=1
MSVSCQDILTAMGEILMEILFVWPERAEDAVGTIVRIGHKVIRDLITMVKVLIFALAIFIQAIIRTVEISKLAVAALLRGIVQTGLVIGYLAHMAFTATAQILSDVFLQIRD